MKKTSLKSLITLTLLLCFHYGFSQCDDITVDSITNPGPYEVAFLNESDGIRNGPDYDGATIYYPTDAPGPFASVALVTGFFSEPEDVEEWGTFYASHGIVVINIGTNSLLDQPNERALALLDALETLRQENIRDDSPLEGQIDENKFAVSGWSMGGGGAQLAATMDASIKAVVALCPWLELDASLNHTTPVLIFSGQNDPTAPPVLHANVQYANTPVTTTKTLFEVENGNHSIANSPTGAGEVVGKIALSWLKLYVENNPCYCPLLNDTLLVDPVASMVQTNLDVACGVLSLETAEKQIVSIYPNPTADFIFIESTIKQNYSLYSTLGDLVLSGRVDSTNNQIDLSALPSNVYYLKMESNSYKILKSN